VVRSTPFQMKNLVPSPGIPRRISVLFKRHSHHKGGTLMFEKKLSEYVRFESWVLILIVVVLLARLGLLLRGSSFEQIRWVGDC
jgi:hypothetical protein